MKKKQLIKNLIEFNKFEENITLNLTKNYLNKLKNSELTAEEQKQVKKRLNILMKETKEHEEKFTNLIEKVKKSEKEEF